MLNTSRRSGAANPPKLDRCASPQSCTSQPGPRRAGEIGRHQVGRAAVERERRDQHPPVADRHQLAARATPPAPRAARPDRADRRPAPTRRARTAAPPPAPPCRCAARSATVRWGIASACFAAGRAPPKTARPSPGRRQSAHAGPVSRPPPELARVYSTSAIMSLPSRPGGMSDARRVTSVHGTAPTAAASSPKRHESPLVVPFGRFRDRSSAPASPRSDPAARRDHRSERRPVPRRHDLPELPHLRAHALRV